MKSMKLLETKESIITELSFLFARSDMTASGVTVFGESVICVLEKESDIVFIFLILSLYEQMLSPITGFEKSLGFYDHTIRKNKVRGIRCQFSVTDLQSFVLKFNPLPFKGEGCILFKLRTELHSTMLDSLLRFLHLLVQEARLTLGHF